MARDDLPWRHAKAAARVGFFATAKAVALVFGVPFFLACAIVLGVGLGFLVLFGGVPGEAAQAPERASFEEACRAVSPSSGPESEHALPWGAAYAVWLLSGEGAVSPQKIAEALRPEFRYETVEYEEREGDEVRKVSVTVLKEALTYRGRYVYSHDDKGNVTGVSFAPDSSKLVSAFGLFGVEPSEEDLLFCMRAAEAISAGEPYLEWLDDEEYALSSSVDWESLYSGAHDNVFLWPAPGPVSSGFGMRVHPVYGWSAFHQGVDIAAPMGSPVRAAASGLVAFSGYLRGLGNAVVLDHGGGLFTVYGHCLKTSVSRGEEVERGDVVAYVGSTGVSTGPHLHFEVRVHGRAVDPMRFFAEAGP